MPQDEAIAGPAGPERVGALRGEMERRGLAGFIVPRADEHQGEYVPPSAQRLAWLTGFTGSAGVAVVLADRAAIFVDGRYTLQVAAEVDAARFEPLHLIDHPPTRWLGEVLRGGEQIGFDPWLHTADQAEALRSACERSGARLVACDGNPLDAVWIGRPAAPSAQVEIHPLEFSGRPSCEKRIEVAKALLADKLDAAVLSAPDSIAWLLNVRGGDVAYSPLPLSFAILHSSGAMDWFIDPGKIASAVADHVGGDVHMRHRVDLDAALDHMGRRGARVRLDKATAPVRLRDRLQAAGARLDMGADPCQLPKARKNPIELAGSRAAHRRDGAAMTEFMAWLAEQPAGRIDEMAASDALEGFRSQGLHFRGLSFPTISGAAANGAIVHYRSSPATTRPLAAGDLYLVDSGAQYLDGTTDVTRTLAIGRPTARQRRDYTLVLKGHAALARAVFPAGTTGSQLDVLARQFLWRAGLDYDHGTGHGVGSYLSVHEGPQRVSKMGNQVPLEPGMIVSNEPGYYRTGAYGIRIENLLAVVSVKAPTGAERKLLGFEPLTLVPFERSLIDTGLLDEGERLWIDTYHARVVAEIGPLLGPQAARWLRRASRSLGSPGPSPARGRSRR